MTEVGRNLFGDSDATRNSSESLALKPGDHLYDVDPGARENIADIVRSMSGPGQQLELPSIELIGVSADGTENKSSNISPNETQESEARLRQILKHPSLDELLDLLNGAKGVDEALSPVRLETPEAGVKTSANEDQEFIARVRQMLKDFPGFNELLQKKDDISDNLTDDMRRRIEKTLRKTGSENQEERVRNSEFQEFVTRVRQELESGAKEFDRNDLPSDNHGIASLIAKLIKERLKNESHWDGPGDDLLKDALVGFFDLWPDTPNTKDTFDKANERVRRSLSHTSATGLENRLFENIQKASLPPQFEEKVNKEFATKRGIPTLEELKKLIPQQEKPKEPLPPPDIYPPRPLLPHVETPLPASIEEAHKKQVLESSSSNDEIRSVRPDLQPEPSKYIQYSRFRVIDQTELVQNLMRAIAPSGIQTEKARGEKARTGNRSESPSPADNAGWTPLPSPGERPAPLESLKGLNFAPDEDSFSQNDTYVDFKDGPSDQASAKVSEREIIKLADDAVKAVKAGDFKALQKALMDAFNKTGGHRYEFVKVTRELAAQLKEQGITVRYQDGKQTTTQLSIHRNGSPYALDLTVSKNDDGVHVQSQAYDWVTKKDVTGKTTDVMNSLKNSKREGELMDGKELGTAIDDALYNNDFTKVNKALAVSLKHAYDNGGMAAVNDVVKEADKAVETNGNGPIVFEEKGKFYVMTVKTLSESTKEEVEKMSQGERLAEGYVKHPKQGYVMVINRGPEAIVTKK